MAEIAFPPKLKPLFAPHRYKILWGGRGSGKSWNIARALLLMALQRPLRILCAREFQNSIADSVHKLLADQIAAMGLQSYYKVLGKTIEGKNGSEFIFAGLRHNINSIKSKEGIDVVWVEEAQLVSANSWDTLIPTIRKSGSEIIVSFNPELDTDDTYVRFIISPPADSQVIHLTWRDNPWFGETELVKEKDDLAVRDPDAYLTVWEGRCRVALDGAIYANELREATQDGRICAVKYDPRTPVTVIADLGHRDNTSLWFVQKVGMEWRILRSYQNRAQKWEHYLQYIGNAGYNIREIILPHDAEHERITGVSVAELTSAAGRPWRIAPNIAVSEGINAVRTIFPLCMFDEANTKDGLQAMRRYRYNVKNGQVSREPLHDENSDYADSFRYFAVGMSGIQRSRPELKLVDKSAPRTLDLGNLASAGWMK